jgi:hypothetical protein
LEAGGQRQKAIDAYESSFFLPDGSGGLVLWNDPGNLLRGHWLTELDGGKNKKPEGKKPEAVKAEERKVEEKKTEKKKPEKKQDRNTN